MKTVAGVRIPDRALADLLEQAQQQGFRVEKAANGHGLGRKMAGFVVYPPDTAHAPIRFGCTEVNPNHVSNIRADLRKAGFVDQEDAMPRTKTAEPSENAQTMADYVVHGNEDNDVFSTPGERAARLTRSLVEAAGVSNIDSSLVAVAVDGLVAMMTDPKYVAARQHESTHLVDELRAEVAQALEMAATMERERDAALKAADKAADKERQARTDCGQAIKRAEAAEAERDELKRILEPLKAFLGSKA